MASHFGSIGFRFADENEFAQGVFELARTAVVHAIDDECCDRVWTDESGARVVILTRESSIEEMLPCLSGGAASIPVRGAEMLDSEVAKLDVCTEDGQDVCPLLVELEDRALLARTGKLDEARLRLSALAGEIAVHVDADAYLGSQAEGAAKFAPDHLVPAGMFGPEPRAHAMLAAEVLDAESRTNAMTGVSFHWMRVRGIAGIEFDVAVQQDLLETTPSPGNVVSGMFFMTGSLGLAYP